MQVLNLDLDVDPEVVLDMLPVTDILDYLGIGDFLDDMDVAQIVDHLDSDVLLDEIGEAKAIEYFEIKVVE